MTILVVLSLALQDPAPLEPAYELRHDSAVTVLNYSRDGLKLLTGSWESESSSMSAVVWDVITRNESLRISGTDSRQIVLGFTRDGSKIVTLLEGAKPTFWDGQNGKRLSQLSTGEVLAIDMSGDGALLALNRGKNEVFSLLDAVSGNKRLTVEDEGTFVARLHFSPDGKQLAAIEPRRKRISLWNSSTGTFIRSFPTEDRCGWCMEFSSDGQFFAAVGERQQVNLWRVADGEDLSLTQAWRANKLAFSPDGRLLALADPSGIRLIEIASRKELLSLVGKNLQGTPFCLALSPNGREIVAAGNGGAILFWSLVSVALQQNNQEASNKEMLVLWEDLASRDAPRAFRAIRSFVAFGEASVTFLRIHLTRRPLDEDGLRRLVLGLASDDSSKREYSLEAAQGSAHDPALWELIKRSGDQEVKARGEEIAGKAKSPLISSIEELRRSRAVWALELLRAVDALREVASGPEQARQSQEAKCALERLGLR
jgi:WD40 repeat protein